MTTAPTSTRREALLAGLRERLVVSCQARPGEPLHGPAHMRAVAQSVVAGGAAAVRVGGPDDVAAVRAAVEVPVIGLWKDGTRASTSPRPWSTPSRCAGRVPTSWRSTAPDGPDRTAGPRRGGGGAARGRCAGDGRRRDRAGGCSPPSAPGPTWSAARCPATPREPPADRSRPRAGGEAGRRPERAGGRRGPHRHARASGRSDCARSLVRRRRRRHHPPQHDRAPVRGRAGRCSGTGERPGVRGAHVQSSPRALGPGVVPALRGIPCPPGRTRGARHRRARAGARSRRFHLDGQTATVADVLDVRPGLEDAAVRAGARRPLDDRPMARARRQRTGQRGVPGPQPALGRRWGARLGGLAEQGYSPDAFGHPADLPRVLQGFGLSTALVWRGAPPQHARLRWRAPDGSEVFVINQCYYEVEVLWDPASTADRMRQFLDREQQRLPRGPWLLMNGGDHLMPRRRGRTAEQVADAGVVAVPVGLPAFVEAAQLRPRPGACRFSRATCVTSATG